LDAFCKNAAIIGIPESNLQLFVNAITEGGGRSISINGSKCGVHLSDEAVGQLVLCIQQSNLPIESLSLTYHNLSDDIIEYIRDSLLISGVNPVTLEHLNLEGNELTAKGLKYLQLNSSELCPLLSLNLSSNPLNEHGGLAISEALVSNVSLCSLKLNNCGFTLSAIVGLAAGLSGGRRQIQELELNRPILPKYIPGEESSDHFSRVLGGAKSLQALSLKYHNIGDAGARLIAYNLSKAINLISLNLDCNKIGIAGAEALASFLIIQSREKDKALKASQAIGGSQIMANQPQLSVGLQHLKLSYNSINDQGAIALAEAINVNTSLKSLTLKNCNIGDKGLMAIGKSLSVNNTLQFLSIFGNEFQNNETGSCYHELIENRLPYIGLTLDIKTYVVDGVYMIAEQS